MATPIWHDEKLARLKEMVQGGKSYGVIAGMLSVEFGAAVSRNACIGKAHRLGLYDKTRPRRPPRPRVARNVTKFIMRRTASPSICPPPDGQFPNKRKLLELTAHTCRWPVGDPCMPDFFFCGEVSDNTGGQPYCSYHAAAAARRKERLHERVGGRVQKREKSDGFASFSPAD
jgi:GcrA cell cycle regulator